MKVISIVAIFFAVAYAEEKINLEDIERDNLRAESKSSTENTQINDGSTYSVTVKPEPIKQHYQHQNDRAENGDGTSVYESQRQQDKYAIRPEDYHQDAKYSINDVDYQQTSEPIRYSAYQEQNIAPKVLSQAPNYESPRQQQTYYQPEIPVGNHYQSVQQKSVTDRFIKNSNRETLYVKIPMADLLSYYPNLDLSQSSIVKSRVQPLLHRLASQPLPEISIPIYTPPLSREPIYSPSKVTFRVQPQYATYASRYPQLTEAILPNKQQFKVIHSQATLSHQQPQPQAHQQHYLQEIVYNQQPVMIYSTPSHVLTNSHDRPAIGHPKVNAPGQLIYESQAAGQQYAPNARQPLLQYVEVGNHGNQIEYHQAYQQQSNENFQQDYETVPDAPANHLDLPRLPAQNFKPVGSTKLLPISSINVDSHYSQNHLIHSSEPRSLLESYVPSRFLAAQDSERYRERPIQLERGFLPSKINYVQSYKKRKTE